MPAKSKAQQALFGMALAVRKGEMKRSDANKKVLDLADSDISTKDLKDFASTSREGLPNKKKSLKEALTEALQNDRCVNKQFIILKPGFIEHRLDVIKMFLDKGFQVIDENLKKLTLEEAKKLYKTHEKEDFYDDLCNYMSSGWSMAFLLVPPVDEEKAYEVTSEIKDKIREKFGLDEMKNALHSSDSHDHMKEESKIFFQ